MNLVLVSVPFYHRFYLSPILNGFCLSPLVACSAHTRWASWSARSTWSSCQPEQKKLMNNLACAGMTCDMTILSDHAIWCRPGFHEMVLPAVACASPESQCGRRIRTTPRCHTCLRSTLVHIIIITTIIIILCAFDLVRTIIIVLHCILTTCAPYKHHHNHQHYHNCNHHPHHLTCTCLKTWVHGSRDLLSWWSDLKGQGNYFQI